MYSADYYKIQLKVVKKERYRLKRANARLLKSNSNLKKRSVHFEKMYIYERKKGVTPTRLRQQTRNAIHNNLTVINAAMCYLICLDIIKKMKVSAKHSMLLLMAYNFEFFRMEDLKRAFPGLIKDKWVGDYQFRWLLENGFLQKYNTQIYFISHSGVIFVDKLALAVMKKVRAYGVGFKTTHELSQDLRHQIRITGGKRPTREKLS
jgi:hypothetical protein